MTMNQKNRKSTFTTRPLVYPREYALKFIIIGAISHFGWELLPLLRIIPKPKDKSIVIALLEQANETGTTWLQAVCLLNLSIDCVCSIIGMYYTCIHIFRK